MFLQSNSNNQQQPGNNPQKSLTDKIISAILEGMGVLGFFGITGQDVTGWIVDGFVWVINHALWFFMQAAMQIHGYIHHYI